MELDPFVTALRRDLLHEVDIEHVSSTGSTNDDLKRRARQSHLQLPLLLVADQQTAGRGTHGRTWRMPKLSLIFSLALPVSHKTIVSIPGLLSLAAAMAVAEGASVASSEKILVKWPNDVWACSGKAGGILCELVTDPEGGSVLVVGVGLNLSVEPGGRTTAGWPITAIPTRVSLQDPMMRGEFLALLVNTVIETFTALEKTSGAASTLVERWPLFDAFFNQPVTWLSSGQSTENFVGFDRGIDAEGELLIEGRNGERRTLSGELVSLLNREVGS